MNRRQFTVAVPAAVGGSVLLAGCGSGRSDYEAAAASTWRIGSTQGLEGAALRTELVRYATLAPSSHNTQCWKFRLDDGAITILPDLARRCPAVDPDDHHLFVSLGCAAENLVVAAAALGLRAEPSFDAASESVRNSSTPRRMRDRRMPWSCVMRPRQPRSYSTATMSSRRATASATP